jgi:hypothetical protein
MGLPLVAQFYNCSLSFRCMPAVFTIEKDGIIVMKPGLSIHLVYQDEAPADTLHHRPYN